MEHLSILDKKTCSKSIPKLVKIFNHLGQAMQVPLQQFSQWWRSSQRNNVNSLSLWAVYTQEEEKKEGSCISSSCSPSVQFSRLVMSESLRPHEPQHARPLCPSTTPRIHPNPYPLSRWCHPIITSSVIPFSSCPQSIPASGSFPMSQLSASDGQIIWVSAATSVLPMNTQDWPPLGWTGWISLQSKELSRVFSNTTVQKHQKHWRHQFFGAQLSL